MSYIGNQPVLNTSEFREEFAVTTNQTVFNTGGFTASSDSATLEVLRNGVLLGTADYTLGSDASTVTLANAAVNGDIIVIKGRRELTNGVQVTERRHEHTIASGETTVTFPYPLTVSQTDVYLNGVKLGSSDFSINSSTRVVSFTTNPAVGDLVAIVSREPALTANSSLPVVDAAGTNVLSESGGVVTLTADEANVGSNALVVDSSGNVGIGTNSATSKLQVEQNQAAYTYFDLVNATNGGGAIFRLIVRNIANTGTTSVDFAKLIGSGLVINNNDTNAANFTSFGVGASERMRIDSSGKVLINEQNRWRGSGQISMSLSSDDGISIKTPYAGLIVRKSSYTNNYLCLWENNSGSIIGSITTNGSSTSYVTTSDYRLKENITEITDGINRVKQLNPSRFNFISDPDKIVDGFIAHEVSDIVPEAISGEKDAVNEDGSINPQGIDQSKLVPLLTAALQESIALIESQQSQIDALTARIEALETPAE